MGKNSLAFFGVKIQHSVCNHLNTIMPKISLIRTFYVSQISREPGLFNLLAFQNEQYAATVLFLAYIHVNFIYAILLFLVIYCLVNF